MSVHGRTIGTIAVTVSEDHTLTIKSDGEIAPQDLIMSAFYLQRTANMMLDAAAYQAAKRTDPDGIAIARAMPDPAHMPKGVS